MKRVIILSILTLVLLSFMLLNPGGSNISGLEAATTQDRLEVYFIDVGQGDSILIDYGATEVLIDGGDKSPGVVNFLQQHVQGPLECVIATHPHADHIGGLTAVLNTFTVQNVWTNGETSTSVTYQNFMAAVTANGAAQHIARRGDTITAGDLSLPVINPVNTSGTTNNNSIVLKLFYGNTSFQFEGDAEQSAEADMLGAGLIHPADVLKVGHHGSRTASSSAFLAAVQPHIAVYMAETGNSYGHPHPETITGLIEIGAAIYGTDVDGTVEISTDMDGPIEVKTAVPIVTNSIGASNVMSNTARLNGELYPTVGANSTVHVFWGPADGGVTPGNWAHDVNLGMKSAGTFFSDISGLTALTPYYYRCYAINSAGGRWAAGASTFTTPLPSTSTTLNSSANPATFGHNVTFTANVVAAPPTSGTPTGMVAFKEGDVLLGTGALTSGQANLTLNNLSVGIHSITAEYAGDGSFSGSTSNEVSQQIQPVPAPFISAPAVLPAGEVKTSYPPQTLKVFGGDGPYKWSWKADPGSSLPPGLSLKAGTVPDTSVILGKPSKAGTYKYTVSVIDRNMRTAERSLTITVYPGMSISASKLPAAEVSVNYSYAISISGGLGPYDWSHLKGNLPDGLSITSTGGSSASITGIPTTPGTFSLTVLIRDSLHGSISKALTLKVLKPLVITTASLPSDDIGVTYKSTTLKATGGTGKYSWSAAGELPPGLSLSSKGVISGKPLPGSSGVRNITFIVRDGTGEAEKELAITIYEPLSISVAPPFPENSKVGDEGNYMLTAGGGCGSGYKWSVSKLPAGLKLNAKTGIIAGTLQKAGVYTFTIKLSDSLRGKTTKEITMKVMD